MNPFVVQPALTGMNAMIMNHPINDTSGKSQRVFGGQAAADKQTASAKESEQRDLADRIDRQMLEAIAESRSRVVMQQFYQRYQTRLLPFLQRMTPDRSLTEEVYNDVMLTVWDKAESFRGQSRVSSWVFSIAYRACLRRLKRHQVYQKLKDFLSFSAEQQEELTHNEASQLESGDLVAKALKTLPDKQRIVVELAYFEGYSVAEIAEIADCPVNSVKTRLFHARKKLGQYLTTQQGASDYADTISL